MHPLPFEMVIALIVCAVTVLAIGIAVKPKKRSAPGSNGVLGLTAAPELNAAVAASEASANGAGEKSKGRGAKRKDLASVVDERKVDETIRRFILSN